MMKRRPWCSQNLKSLLKHQNDDDNLQVLDPLDKIVIRDEVYYTDLIVGKEYEIKGILMDKTTGKAVLVNGSTVESELTFVAVATSGTVELFFELDAQTLKGKELVVFDNLYRNNTLLFAHNDLNDVKQTVRITQPDLNTTATHEEDGLSIIDPLDRVVIKDAVEYSDLIIGKEYTVSGVLMDKGTGQVLLVNGEEIRSELTFVATATSGTVNLLFELDAQTL